MPIGRLLAATTLVAGSVLAAAWMDVGRQRPRAVILDVGQGDAVYVRTPDGQDILVDAGPSNGHVVDRLREQLPRGDGDIELLVSTHLDADHSGGMVDVLEAFSVERVATNGDEPTTKTGHAFLDAVDAEPGAEHTTFARGQQLTGRGWRADVLWPTTTGPGSAAAIKETNDASIVIRLQTAEHCILLTGDISDATEKQLTKDPQSLRCENLKVSHHGSKTSSSQAFLMAVDPDTAIISVGAKNSYGHPTQQALDRLRATGATIRRTDEEGSVTVPL